MRSTPVRRWRSSLRPVAALSTPGILLLLLLAASAVVSPDLFSLSGLGGALGDAAPLILSVLAIMPVALSAPAAIDLSIGPLIVFVNVGIVHWLVPAGIGGPLPVFVFAILAGVAFEVLQGVVINVVRLQPVIVTLSGYLVLGGLNLIVLPQAGGTVPYWLGTLGSPTTIFAPALVVVAACFVGWTLLARTAFARNLRLVGGNERAAFVSGVRLTATRLGAHAVAGAIAGVAGVMLSGLLQSADPTAGSSQTLMAVTALVVGGVSLSGGQGRALGAFLGAVDVFLIGNVLGTFQLGEASSFVTQVAYGVILVAAIVAGKLVGARQGRRAVPSPAAVEELAEADS